MSEKSETHSDTPNVSSESGGTGKDKRPKSGKEKSKAKKQKVIKWPCGTIKALCVKISKGSHH